jgi:hypothetical protein
VSSWWSRCVRRRLDEAHRRGRAEFGTKQRAVTSIRPDPHRASLRVERAGAAIGVTILNPGVVDTGFFDRRGVPYHRRFPRPASPDRIAAALVKGVSRDRAEVVVPGWLRLPIALRACAPGAYWRLAGRWA